MDAPSNSDSGANFGGAIIKGLQATPGFLGYDTADATSGKHAIFAWFHDKKAVLSWYYSDAHQALMRQFFPDDGGTPDDAPKPMDGVPDGVPIMVIASLTLTDDSQLQESSMPISQIAVELYTPVTGGLFLGSRFAPDKVVVENMSNYT